MDCSLIQSELALYHLGTVGDEERARIDTHLLECNECLRAYFAVKRHIDAERIKPSAELRARLSLSVREAFRSTTRSRVQRWLQRPIPVYQGIAAAAMALIFALAAPLLAKGSVRTQLKAGGVQIDTARAHPEKLDLL